MDTIVTKLKPLDWPVFWQKQKDETQVLKVGTANVTASFNRSLLLFSNYPPINIPSHLPSHRPSIFLTPFHSPPSLLPSLHPSCFPLFHSLIRYHITSITHHLHSSLVTYHSWHFQVVASGLLLRKAVVMSAAKKNFQTLEELTQCMRCIFLSKITIIIFFFVIFLYSCFAEGSFLFCSWLLINITLFDSLLSYLNYYYYLHHCF